MDLVRNRSQPTRFLEAPKHVFGESESSTGAPSSGSKWSSNKGEEAKEKDEKETEGRDEGLLGGQEEIVGGWPVARTSDLPHFEGLHSEPHFLLSLTFYAYLLI